MANRVWLPQHHVINIMVIIFTNRAAHDTLVETLAQL